MRKTKLAYAVVTIAIILIAVVLLFAQGSGYNAYQSTVFSSVTTGATIPQQGLIKYHQLIWTVTGAPAGCTVALDTSADGSSFSAGGAIAGQTCTSNGSSAITGVVSANFLRVNVTALSGGTAPTVTVVYEGWAYNPSGTTSATTTATLPVGLLTTGTCATVVQVAVSGAATTSVVSWDYASDPSGVVGYGSSGGLTVTAFGTSGNANFRQCNPTAGSITPGAMSLNFRVIF